jgi:hypothetical protein
MKTASHFDYKGPGRVVISRGNPRGVPGGYKMFKKLAPTAELLKADLPQAEYRKRFFTETLEPLDAQTVWDELHALHPGVEPVLQCFERPPLTECNYCHRTMVAEWFADKLGADVQEVG